MGTQNYSNHRQTVPGYHYLVYILIFLALGFSVRFAYGAFFEIHHERLLSVILLILSAAMLLIAWYARVFPLKAQDRAIRAEENLRHFVHHGQLLDPRLTTRQIIALRFADDAEFSQLATRAANENMSPGDIKKAIQNWKADHYRV
ncbi:MAG: hypothetical protein NVSMB45_09730 [Ginsengibacter sp.]